MPDKEAIARLNPATPMLRIREISCFSPNAKRVPAFGFATAWVVSSLNPFANEDLPPYLHCDDRLYRMRVFLGDERSHLPSKRLKLADGTLPPQDNDG
ncbi:hypothetical protein NDI49_18595 [Trichocoleus sp. ST-U3]